MVLRAESRPLPRKERTRGGIANLMRKLLTDYVVSFNRRHKRSGQLLQNRYKSIVCDEEVYSGNSSATSSST